MQISPESESPKKNLQPSNLSHFGKSREHHFISSLEDISEKEMRDHSLNTISETSKSFVNETSAEIREKRKKPILHVFTQGSETSNLFYQNMIKINDKKSTITIFFFII